VLPFACEALPMKNYFFFALFVVLALIPGCTKSCSSNKEAAKNILKIGTNAGYPPFESIDEKGNLIGFDIDMGRALAKELGKEAAFKEFDFDALVLALKKGQIDIIMAGLSITESRQQEIAMVPYQGKPLTEISFLFWDKIPREIHNFEDLKALAQESKLSISVQAGHFLEDFLKSLGLSVKALAGPPEQILDIKYNKSLAAALDSTNGKSLADKHENLKIVTLELPKDRWDLGNGIGINKSRTDLIEQIKEAVLRLKENGTVNQLEQKWIVKGEQ
jgi:arginine transport system substrate-binding protein